MATLSTLRICMAGLWFFFYTALIGAIFTNKYEFVGINGFFLGILTISIFIEMYEDCKKCCCCCTKPIPTATVVQLPVNPLFLVVGIPVQPEDILDLES